MKSSTNKFDIKRWIPGLIISALAIFVLFQLVSWEDLDQAFSTIHLVFLLPGIALVLLWLYLRAAALKVILGGKPTVWQAFRAINIGYLLNNILPLRAGELGKAVVLGRSTGTGTSYILSGIVIERAFDLIYAAGLLLLALPFVLEMDWTRPVAIGVLVIVVLGIAALYMASKNYKRIQSWMENLGNRVAWVRKFILPQMNSFFKGLQTLTDFRRFLLSLMMIGSSWLVAVILYYVMLFSITPDPNIWWGVFINSILAMGIALPSAPAALGVFEASLVAGLGVLGITYSYALAYAVMMHFLQFAITGILGSFSLAREKQSITDLLSANREKKADVSEDMISSEQTQ
jgi:uncharacterized protein (TIRG00374 family)